ncbi:MAG: TetR/AcrR family transcriptional regulator [Methanolinea sp.]|nr:TetR/AcrR family transcriptional regulator [Methanolinea sp.]
MPRINTEYREDAKKKIISAALEIAAENGWDAMTLDAIAKKVGVTKGALYAYFEHSEALQREVILEVIRKVRVGMERILEGEEDPRIVLERAAGLIFEDQRAYAAIFCQIPVRISGNSLYQEEFRTFFSGVVVLVRNYLARMKKKGTLSQKVDPEQAAGAMMALTMGLRMSALFFGRDEREAKQVWLSSVERILLLEPVESVPTE